MRHDESAVLAWARQQGLLPQEPLGPQPMHPFPVAAMPDYGPPELQPEPPTMAPMGGGDGVAGLMAALSQFQAPPLPPMRRGEKRGGERFLYSLLSSLPQGLVASWLAQQQREGATREEINKAIARIAARDLAKYRWTQETQQKRIEAAQKAATEQRVEAAATRGKITVQTPEGPKLMSPSEATIYKELQTGKPAVTKPEPIAADDEMIAALAESVASGQTQLSEYPFALRPKIVRFLVSTGQTILPKKARDTINTINAGHSIVGNLEALSPLVNTATTPAERLTTGARRSLEAALQTNPNAAVFNATRQGFLATIARAAGERGVLTDQDVRRASMLVPNMYDTKIVAQRKIAQLRAFLDGLEARTIATYTTRHPSLTPPIEPGPAAKPMDWFEQNAPQRAP